MKKQMGKVIFSGLIAVFVLGFVIVSVQTVSADPIWDGNYTHELWDTFDGKLYPYLGGGIEIGDVDNDGVDEIVMVSGEDWHTANKSILIYEKGGTYALYENALSYSRQCSCISVHDVDSDGSNEFVTVNIKTGGWITDLLRFNTTAITNSKLGMAASTKSGNSKSISWINISNEEHFYSTGCGAGDTVEVFNNFTKTTINEIDDFSTSGEDNLAWDIDGDGEKELLVISGYSANAAKVWMYEIDNTTGNYTSKTMLFDNDLSSNQYYTAAMQVGDVDNDGIDNLLIFWTQEHPDTPSYVGPIEAYEFDGITEFGEGNYSEGFSVISTADPINGVTNGHNAYVIGDCDNDGDNELLYGTYHYWSYNNSTSNHLWKIEVGLNGSSIEKTSLVEFSTDYFGGAAYPYHMVMSQIFEHEGQNHILLTVGSNNQTVDNQTEVFKMTYQGTGDCTTPVITDLANSIPGTTNVTITWNTNQSADNRIKYSKNSDLSIEEWSSWHNDTSSISIELTSLDSGTPYYYQAWSYNGTNSSCLKTEPVSSPYKNFTTGGGQYEITLLIGWNIIGWTDTTTRTAHYIGTDVGSNCTYITERNKTTGNYVNHNMAGPESEDNFAIERGWGYYAYLTAETVWNRTA